MVTRYQHIFLDQSGDQHDFTTPKGGGDSSKKPPRNREVHGQRIQQKFDELRQRNLEIQDDRRAHSLPVREGTYLQFESAPGYELTLKGLEDRKAGIRLLNVQEDHSQEIIKKTVVRATVYVPAGKEKSFLNKVDAYVNKDTSKGKPKNAPLVESIEDIRLAFLESFWQDDSKLIPDRNPVWCEVWLFGHEPEVEEEFRRFAQTLNIRMRDEVLRFPERTVLLVYV